MRVAALWLCLLGSCAAEAPPVFRLPAIARPLRYELELTIRPAEAAFRGVIRIDVRLAKQTSSLWLNARELSIDQATVTVAEGSPINTRASAAGEFLHLEMDRELPPGPARVEIAYHAALSDKRNDGLYRKTYAGDWYVFSTFTPIEARRAFPCFDEPEYKAPWRVVLHVPESDIAASNAPLKAETSEPGGLKRVEFDQTPPLASEVVAIAVGPFDVVPAGQAGARHIPVRILAPRGRARDAEGARTATAQVLERLEHYTGIPYPWDKLDHVAVLDMPFGAVENPGLITYRDRILLARPERDTLERQRAMRSTMAHELAHQWFGNLVTQAWWDDVWLSEGFATWMGVKISDLELPSFERSLGAAASRAAIMKIDASSQTRPVRLAMNSRTEMSRVYGGIVYQKGAAILNMLEQWLGPDVFERGLRRYLNDHAMGNATTADLAAALRTESGVDVAAILQSFLDQSGFPSVSANPRCAVESPDAARWTIPVCLHGDDGAGLCAQLSPTRQDVQMNACPQWVWPNRGGAGYFRVRLTPASLETLVNAGWEQLSSSEKLSVIDDTADAVLSHRLDAAVALPLLPAMARDPQPAVSNAAYRLLLAMLANSSPEDRPKYDAALQAILRVGRGR